MRESGYTPEAGLRGGRSRLRQCRSVVSTLVIAQFGVRANFRFGEEGKEALSLFVRGIRKDQAEG